MSEWLSIIFVVLIIGIVFDGLRRARNRNKGEVRLSKNARKADKLFNTEVNALRESDFPNGGARLKSSPAYSTGSENSENRGSSGTFVDDSERDSAAIETDSDVFDRSHTGTPEQVSFNLDEPVPLLMDSVLKNDELNDNHIINSESEAEEAFESLEKNHEADTNSASDILAVDKSEPQIGSLSDLDMLEEAVKPGSDYADADLHLSDNAKTQVEPSKAKKSRFSAAADYFLKDKSLDDTSSAEDDSYATPPKEILIINVMARRGEAFQGEELLEAMTGVALKFGEMGIFHRHVDNDGDAASIYSVANIVEPGVFDLSTIKTVQSPGLCMFLSLPCAAAVAVDAYEDLVGTARKLASTLDGELKDENRSALTNQTIEHGRQRVIEFERKNKLHK